MITISDKLWALGEAAEKDLSEQFARVDAIAMANTKKVLSAFQEHRVAEGDFVGTTGYGYDDEGRDKLERIYAQIFGTQDALVRLQFVNGTHAITSALFGCLRPGDTLVSGIGAPYDTMLGVIGAVDKGSGSLKDYGVNYCEVPLLNNAPNKKEIVQAVKQKGVKAILLQRSRGYATRASLSIEDIKELCGMIREANREVFILVDNCYGEFVEELEPTQVGADLVVGSLIKNPGGGLAPTGGYLAGRQELIEGAAARLTAPGIGKECGCTLGHDRSLYQGLFLAPHTTAQAVKTALFAARLMEKLGFEVDPKSTDIRHDIIQMIHLREPEAVKGFCRGIQSGSPVDSYVTPEPWDMPGYDSQVIMAAGAFIQGASIELSCDAPMREPYTVYLQGGLTYESGKLGILLAAQALKER